LAHLILISKESTEGRFNEILKQFGNENIEILFSSMKQFDKIKDFNIAFSFSNFLTSICWGTKYQSLVSKYYIATLKRIFPDYNRDLPIFCFQSKAWRSFFDKFEIHSLVKNIMNQSSHQKTISQNVFLLPIFCCTNEQINYYILDLSYCLNDMVMNNTLKIVPHRLEHSRYRIITNNSLLKVNS
jgi:hypothetical protein